MKKKTHKLIIDVFRQRKNYLLNHFQPQPLRTPNVLPRLPLAKLSKLIETISKGKALSLMNNSDIFKSKLIPLNKKHPQVPLPNQIRPIVVTNPFFKLMEVKFTEGLTRGFNMLSKFSEAQTGFIKGMSTQVNILRLLDFVRRGYYSSDLHNQSP